MNEENDLDEFMDEDINENLRNQERRHIYDEDDDMNE
jgi:hypothetical protein